MNIPRCVILLLLLLLVQGPIASAQTENIIANDSGAIFTVTSLTSGELIHVESGTFHVDTQKRVTLMGDWGAVTIADGAANLTVKDGAVEVLAVGGTALVFQTADPGCTPTVLRAGEKLSWTAGQRQPILTSLGQCE